MKRKGFTLVELLVVISIIALLMAILMPVLAKVKAIANQMVCGTNLSGIGKGMMLYAGDNDDQYPLAGGRQPIWATGGAIADAFPNPATTPPVPYGTLPVGNPATITASFYLLIKYTDMGPEQFVCKGDTGTTKLKLADYGLAWPNFELTDAWDFGRGAAPNRAADHCSYSYHMPYSATGPAGLAYPISPASNPGSPIAADRDPYADKNATSYVPTGAPPGTAPTTGELAPSWQTSPAPAHYLDRFKTSNAACHQRNGQNVLFNDIHVTFEKYPNVGINQDNIWIFWATTTAPPDAENYQVKGGGFGGRIGSAYPRSEKDALLCSERD